MNKGQVIADFIKEIHSEFKLTGKLGIDIQILHFQDDDTEKVIDGSSISVEGRESLFYDIKKKKFFYYGNAPLQSPYGFGHMFHFYLKDELKVIPVELQNELQRVAKMYKRIVVKYKMNDLGLNQIVQQLA